MTGRIYNTVAGCLFKTIKRNGFSVVVIIVLDITVKSHITPYY